MRYTDEVRILEHGRNQRSSMTEELDHLSYREKLWSYVNGPSI